VVEAPAGALLKTAPDIGDLRKHALIAAALAALIGACALWAPDSVKASLEGAFSSFGQAPGSR
jgi:hypothetical protein